MSKQKTYSEKLKDPRWQKMRLQILERDKWCCRYCLRNDKTLHVHHLWYERRNDPWEYPPEALLTLCEDCHQRETDVRKEVEALLIRTLRERRWSVPDLKGFASAVGGIDPMEVYGDLGRALTWVLGTPEALNDLLTAFFHWQSIALSGSIVEGVRQADEEAEYINAAMEKRRASEGEGE